MFETALSYNSSTERYWTTAMGFTGQALLIGCAVLAPLLSPQTLGRAYLVTALAAPGAPPAPAPPPGPMVVPRPHAATKIFNGGLIEPTSVPTTAAIMIVDPPEAAGSGPGVPGGVPGGIAEGGSGSIVRSIIEEGARMAVARVPEAVNRESAFVPPAPVKPPRVTAIRLATPIHKVEPIYPALARQARVSGTVELLGVLGTDGRIHELKVLRGHPLLVNAALDAVRQWIFEPTLLNGQPVEVAAPITVNFILH